MKIAKGLGWSYGKVKGVVNCMEGRVRKEDLVESGRIKKRLYLIMADEFLE